MIMQKNSSIHVKAGEKAQPNIISLQRRENIEGLIPSYGSWIYFFSLNFAFFSNIFHVTY